MLLFDSCNGPERSLAGSPGLCGSCRRQPLIPEPSTSRELSTSRGLFATPEPTAIYRSPLIGGLDDSGFRETLPSPGHSVSTWQSPGLDTSVRQPLPVGTWQSVSTVGSDRQMFPGSNAALGIDSDPFAVLGDDSNPLVNGKVPDLALVYSLLNSVSHLHLKPTDHGSQVSRPLPVDQIASRESWAISREHSRANTSHTLSREYSRADTSHSFSRQNSRVHTAHSRERSRVQFDDAPGAPEASRPSRAEIVLVGEVKRLEKDGKTATVAAQRLWHENKELQRRVQDLHGRNSLLQGKNKDLEVKYQDLHEHLADATFLL